MEMIQVQMIVIHLCQLNWIKEQEEVAGRVIPGHILYSCKYPVLSWLSYCELVISKNIHRWKHHTQPFCQQFVNKLLLLTFLSAAMFWIQDYQRTENKISASCWPWLFFCGLSWFLLAYKFYVGYCFFKQSQDFPPRLSYTSSNLGLKVTIWTMLHWIYQLFLSDLL